MTVFIGISTPDSRTMYEGLSQNKGVFMVMRGHVTLCYTVSHGCVFNSFN